MYSKSRTNIHSKKSYLRPVKKPPMTHHLTYRPQPAQIPADSHRGDRF